MRNLRKPRRDFAIIALAGPLINILLGFIFAFVYLFTFAILRDRAFDGLTLTILQNTLNFLYLFHVINIGIALFNLIPIPPLDGSNVLMCALPPKVAMQYSKLRYYSHYIMIGIVLLNRMPYPLSMISDIIFMPLDFLRGFLSDAIITVGNLIFSFIF
jgi:Zn-dependent protease